MIDVSHSLFDFLNKQKSDYLILDSGWGRFNYFILENGSVITEYNTNFIDFLIQNKYIPNIKKRVTLQSIPKDTLEKLVADFCSNLLKYYREKQIIIIEIKPAYLYVTKENAEDKYSVCKFFGKNHSEYKMGLVFDLLKKYLKNAHFIKAPDIRLADAGHVWGLNPLHFVREIYTDYYYPCIKEIIYNHTDSDNHQHNLNIINTKFNNMEYEKYFSLFYSEIMNQPVKKNLEKVKTVHNTHLYVDITKLTVINIKDDEATNNIYPVHLNIVDDMGSLTFAMNDKTYYIKIIDNFSCIFTQEPYFYSIEYNVDNTVSIKNKYGYLSANKNGLCNMKANNLKWEHYFIQDTIEE